MADKVCSNCGKDLPAAAVFCSRCGSRDLHDVGYAPVTEAVPPAGSVITPDSPTIPVSSMPPPAPPAEAPFSGDFGNSGPTVMDDSTSVWSSSAASTPPPPEPVAYAPPSDPYPPAQPRVTLPTPAAPSSSGGGRFGAAIVLLGGAVAIVGAFLDWMKITPGWADSFTLSGWTLSDDAKIALGLGAVAIVAAVVVLGGMLRGPVRIVAAALGIVLIGLGAYDTYDIIQRLPDALEKAGVGDIEISAPGIGLILVIVGGVFVLLGALAMASPEPRSPSATGAAAAPGSTAPPPPTGHAHPTPGTAPAAPGYAAPPTGYAPPPVGSTPPPTGYAPPTPGYPDPTTGHVPPATGPVPPPGGYPPPPSSGW